MREKDYFTKHFRSDELGEYVAISSQKFKLVVREYKEMESHITELEEKNEKLRDALVSIANKDKTRQENEEYWLSKTHDECANVLATDTTIARQTLKETE